MSVPYSNKDLYLKLSEAIQIESESYTGQLIDELAYILSDDYDENLPYPDNSRSPIRHNITLLALKVLKFTIESDSSLFSFPKQTTEQFEEICYLVKALEHASSIDDVVAWDTIDCIMSVSSGDSIDLIKRRIDRKYWQGYDNRDGMSDDLYYLLQSLAEFYISNSYIDVGETVIDYIINISMSRTANDAQSFRWIVVDMARSFSTVVPQKIHSVLKEHILWFEDIEDELSGDFYWYYANMLLNVGNADDSVEAFKKCYRIRCQYLGENNWFTVLAKREYAVISIFKKNDVEDNRDFLINIIKNIENNVYSEIDHSTQRLIEGLTLLALLEYKQQSNDLTESEYYLDIFMEICDEFNDDISQPGLKKRTAYNYQGIFSEKYGNYIMAEQAFLKAIDAIPPAGTPDYVTVFQIKSNLLLTYINESEFDLACQILDELFGEIENDDNDIPEKEIIRIKIIQISFIDRAYIDIDDDFGSVIKEDIESFANSFNSERSEEEYLLYCLYIIGGIDLLFASEMVTNTEARSYYELLINIEQTGILQQDIHKSLLFLIIASLLRKDDISKACTYITKAVLLCTKLEGHLNVKAEVFRLAVIILCKAGRIKEVEDYIENIYSIIEEELQSFTHYINDNRLLQIVVPSQLVIMTCFAVKRQITDNFTELYNDVLRFKNLASLVGRERNRILNEYSIDPELLQEIKGLQDEIAVGETNSVFFPQIEPTTANRNNRLRELEAELARQFPNNYRFTSISTDMINDKLSDNTALIEYYMTLSDLDNKTSEMAQESMIFEVFVILKRTGIVYTYRYTIEKGLQISEQAQAFIEILQAESNNDLSIAQAGMKEQLRIALYDSLISPIRGVLDGIETLYIAPDADIVNVPFEILSDNSGELFGDAFTIIKIECGRDLVYGNHVNSTGLNSLIVGNPKFMIGDDTNPKSDVDSHTYGRLVEISSDEIEELPFSQIEVEHISTYCNSTPITGDRADKKVFSLVDNNTRIIHIATHGSFDNTMESDSIYASCLLFAGVKNWLQTNNIDHKYGNGIITADEISRMNFHCVDLVVLSTCLSGMSESVFVKGFHGMIGGFSAAGVKYVISNLWCSDDLATLVFMDAFYKFYIIENAIPPLALKKAKEYMRNATLNDLHDLFSEIIDSNESDYKMVKRIEDMNKKGMNYKPYRKEIYWAGFNCVQCN